MSHLIVVGFKNDRYKANEALNKLRKMDYWNEELEDAVAVSRSPGGELRMDQSYKLATEEGMAWGGLWGSFLGLLVAIPFTGGASVPAAAAAGAALLGGTFGATTGAIGAAWWKGDYGIPEDFVYESREMIQPGDSAIFALVSHVYDEGIKQFEGFGGTVLKTTLTPEQDAKIQKVLRRGA
ncbi:MAG: DUF1269 domain-containing protein [Pyrinomonadaceae bacterium]